MFLKRAQFIKPSDMQRTAALIFQNRRLAISYSFWRSYTFAGTTVFLFTGRIYY